MAAQSGLVESFRRPQLVLDPIWSLRPWPLDVYVAGVRFVIPALPAVEWLAPLMTDPIDLDDILPGILGPDDRDRFDALFVQGKLSLEASSQLSLDVIQKVSGRKWWVALRLIGAAGMCWDYIGARMATVDATKTSLASWLDVACDEIVSNLSDESRTSFYAALEAVPAEEMEQEQEALEMTPEAFLRLAG